MSHPSAPSSAIGLSCSLPVEVSSFIGREREVAAVRGLLPQRRLITITGVGGSGKTRLALRVARSEAGLVPLPSQTTLAAPAPTTEWDCVCWVSLEGLTAEESVLHAVAETLGVREASRQPLVQTVVEHLTPRRALLVLDHCEHLVGACVSLMSLWLAQCPALHILATSQARLGLRGETVWPIPPLSVPPSKLADTGAPPTDLDVVRFEAVALFVERACEAAWDFDLTPKTAPLVAQICRRLDGIPLAIELAAARVRLLSIEQIASRLDNALHLLEGEGEGKLRHATLRATMEWSYRLLTPLEQTLLRRLAVFVGGFSLEATEEVTSDVSTHAPGHASASGEVNPSQLERERVLDLLGRLVDKSLVMVTQREPGAARYRLLEPVRLYGREKLQAAGEEAVLQVRYLAYYRRYAETLEARSRTAPEARSDEEFEIEHDNFRATLRLAFAQGAIEDAARLASALSGFWHVCGYYTEGREALEQVLAQGTALAEPLRARICLGAGLLASVQSDYTTAQRRYDEALALYRRLDDKRGIATCLKQLGIQAGNQGDYATAVALSQSSLTLYREVGDEGGMAGALNNLGVWAREQGEYEHAFAAYSESLALYRSLGNEGQAALVLYNLGEVLRDQGRPNHARLYIEESLKLYEALDDDWGRALNWQMLARLDEDAGRYPQAAERYRTSLELWATLGNKRRLTTGLEGLAGVETQLGQAERAARLLGAAEMARQMIHAPLPPADRAAYQQRVAAARRALGDDLFELAYTYGKTLTLEQAVAVALTPPAVTPSPASGLDLTSPSAPPTPAAPPPTPSAPLATPAGADVGAAAVPRLRIYALGPGQVELDTEAPGPRPPLSDKPKELFFYVLCHPGATKEQIGLELWPQASPTQLRSRFHEAMHRLRRALGSPDWIRVDREHYSFNRRLPSWFDVDVFNQHLEAVGGLREDGAVARLTAVQLEDLNAAIALYQGDFLADAPPSDWILGRREELRQKYLSALMVIGQSLLGSDQVMPAADLFRQVIARERHREEAHRYLMLCYARLGERSKVVWHYHQLSRWLQKEFGSVPDDETTALFQELTRPPSP